MSDTGKQCAMPALSYDWAGTDLGPPDSWPHTLRLTLDMLFGMPVPALLVWGPRLVVVYNEPYVQLAATRSVRAPGGSPPALWPAPLSAARAALERALAGAASVQHGLPVPFVREGRVDTEQLDLYFTPVHDADGLVAGVVCAVAPPSPPPVQEQGGLDILVVEDNLDSQYLVCEMLRALGHEVHGVGDAEAALQQLAEHPVDLLFTDVSLPGMSGVELAREALRHQPGLQVVFASGYGDTLLRHVEFPHASLQKPYDLEQLQAMLATTARR